MLKSIALFIFIVLVILALPFLFSTEGDTRNSVPAEGLPWQIELLPDGATSVFGLVPGRSTLDDACKRFGNDLQVALIVAPGESGAVEVFYESIAVGAITGKMVLTLDTTPEQREQMLKRARKAEFMESTTRRVELGTEDQFRMSTTAIAAIVYIPAASLDESIVLARFGAPAERIRSSETREHFLYPAKGLDLQLDTKGKEILQYVAPGAFGRLREPLVSAGRTERERE